MLSFAYPRLLLLLLLLPVFAGMYVWMRRSRRRKLALIGKPERLAPLMPGVSRYKSILKFTLLSMAYVCLVIAFARPWGGMVETSGRGNGMEVVIAVDASNSMLAPTAETSGSPSRMTTAKVMLERLIGNMSNDRVGLVAFAGEAYQLIPASSDYASARSFLNSISPEEMPVQGTDIESAIKVAEKSFTKNNKDIGKAIVLLTDAEELDDPQAALEAVTEAAANGIQVDVIGVGSDAASTIPYQNGVFRDDSGNTVYSKLNAELGEQLAKAGGGVYVNASSADAIALVQKQLRSMRRASISKGSFAVHDELYIYFAIAALVLLMAEACIGMGRNRLLDKVTFFRRGRSAGFSRKKSAGNKVVSMTVIFLLLAFSSCVSEKYKAERGEREALKKGNEHYADKEFPDASACYEEALSQIPSGIAGSFNLALSDLRQTLSASDSVKNEGYDTASARFDTIAQRLPGSSQAAMSYYNMGNIMLDRGDYNRSIELYKQALRINPSDSLARRNLRIAQLRRPPEDKNQNQNQSNQDNQQDKDKQQQQEQQQQQPQPQQQQKQQQKQPLNQGASDRILQRSQNRESEVRKQLYKRSSQQDVNRRNRIKNW